VDGPRLRPATAALGSTHNGGRPVSRKPPATRPHIHTLGSASRSRVDVARELHRLTGRDRWLVELLHEHQVLTTEQITALGFDQVHTANNRLRLLHQRGILAYFRDPGSTAAGSWCWTLDLVGARWIAAHHGHPTPAAATIRHRIVQTATASDLPHLLAVNGWFTDLAAFARHAPGARLNTWRSARTCPPNTMRPSHPDGFGVWTQDGATRSFVLHHNADPDQAVNLVDGYAALAPTVGGDQAAVLIRLSDPGREAAVHERLAEHPATASGRLVVATSSGSAHPAAPVWLPTGQSARVLLSQLPQPSAGAATSTVQREGSS
jgi:Replication-relaxation